MAADERPFSHHVNRTTASDSGEKQDDDEVAVVSDSPERTPSVRFIRNFDGQERDEHPRDFSVATWILETMYDKGALKILLDTVRSGRRVFQQLCGKGRIPFKIYKTLFDLKEVDLAFRVALSKNKWTSVVPLYSDAMVSRRSRQLALIRAVQQKNWKFLHLLGMATDCKMTQQRVFQQLLRYNQLVLALKMLKTVRNTPRLGSIVSAIDKCLALHKYALACKFLPYLNSSPSRKFWERLLSSCADAGMLSCLLSLSARRQFCQKFCKILFRVSFTAGRSDFVVQFCGKSKPKWRLGVKIAARLGLWEALQTLFRPGYINLSRGLLCMLLKRLTALQQDDPGRLILADLIENRAGEIADLVAGIGLVLFVNDLSKVIDMQYFLSLCQWCKSKGFPNVAFLMALAAEEEDVDLPACRQMLKDCGASLHRDMLKSAGEHIISKSNFDSFFAWMLLWGESASDDINLYRDLNSWHVDVRGRLESYSTSDLLEAFSNNRIKKWALSVAIERHDWDTLTRELSSFHCQDLIDQSITEAAKHAEWAFIERFLPQCSNNLSVLAKILVHVVLKGEVSLATRIMEIKCIDPCQIREYEFKVNHRHTSLLRRIVTKYMGLPASYKLVFWCISTGVSTFEVSSHNCQGEAYSAVAGDKNSTVFASMLPRGVLAEAFCDGDLPLVKILYESGATSNKELLNIRYHIQRYEGPYKELVKYLDEKASQPRSLLSLCRLRMSHLIGCRPGRTERVASLCLPHTLKDLLLFKDIAAFLSSEPTQRANRHLRF